MLVDEEKKKVLDVLSQLQNSHDIRDMQLEEISTEDVIRKIYEDADKENSAAPEETEEGSESK